MTSATTLAHASRLTGIVSPRFSEARVVAVGCGAGSLMQLALARMGVGTMVLVDPDVVERANLCRTAFTVLDVGETKAEALANHLVLANPDMNVVTLPTTVQAAFEQNPGAMQGASLLIAGTDSFAAQAFVNELSCTLRIPAVFIGVHAKARGGRIVYHLPGRTGCLRCVCPERYAAFAESLESRESRVDLPGERGSIIDVGAIDHVALKVCAAILDEGESSEYGGLLAASGYRNDLVVRTHPGYRWDNDIDVFDVVLSDLPTEPRDFRAELKQSAFFCMDSLWLEARRDPACPSCSTLDTPPLPIEEG